MFVLQQIVFAQNADKTVAITVSGSGKTQEEKKEWDFKIKRCNPKTSMEEWRMEAYKQVALAYAQNQPQTIIYNRIIW